MPDYAAFIRGVSPDNPRMADLKRAFEDLELSEIRTVRGSGNVLFSARRGTPSALESRIGRHLSGRFGRSMPAHVRRIDFLRELLAEDPFGQFKPPPAAKRVVTFLREEPASLPAFPIERREAMILGARGREVFSAYFPGPDGPTFMALIEKTFGKDVTTRTWDTVAKVAGQASPSRPS